MTAAARVAVEEQFGSGEWGQTKKLRWVHERAREVWRMWEVRGGKLIKPVQTNQVWLDPECLGLALEESNNLSAELVLHHQIADDAIKTLGMLFDVFQQLQNGLSKGQR